MSADLPKLAKLLYTFEIEQNEFTSIKAHQTVEWLSIVYLCFIEGSSLPLISKILHPGSGYTKHNKQLFIIIRNIHFIKKTKASSSPHISSFHRIHHWISHPPRPLPPALQAPIQQMGKLHHHASHPRPSMFCHKLHEDDSAVPHQFKTDETGETSIAHRCWFQLMIYSINFRLSVWQSVDHVFVCVFRPLFFTPKFLEQISSRSSLGNKSQS